MDYQDDKPTVTAGGEFRRERSKYEGEPAETAYAGAGSNADWGAPGRAKKTEVLRPQTPPTFAWLVVTTGAHAGYVFQLNPEVTTIGRDSALCDFVVDDDYVGGQHLKIRSEKPEAEESDEAREKHFVLYDLATTNGTKVSGEQVLRQPLADGDQIEIGHTVLVFKEL